jgi:hypothetical protein
VSSARLTALPVVLLVTATAAGCVGCDAPWSPGCNPEGKTLADVAFDADGEELAVRWTGVDRDRPRPEELVVEVRSGPLRAPNGGTRTTLGSVGESVRLAPTDGGDRNATVGVTATVRDNTVVGAG